MDILTSKKMAPLNFSFAILLKIVPTYLLVWWVNFRVTTDVCYKVHLYDKKVGFGIHLTNLKPSVWALGHFLNPFLSQFYNQI